MKIIHLIVAFFVSTTALAASYQTHVFFAKVNGTLRPLQVKNVNHLIKPMIWGNSQAKIVEVFYENGTARSACSTDNLISNIVYGFQLSKYRNASVLMLDTQSKLLNSFFYSCMLPISGCNAILPWSLYYNCFLVDVYFLPFDRKTRAPVKGSYVPQKDVERIPHVFFVQLDNQLEPVYSKAFEPDESRLIPLHHGQPGIKPLEFFVQKDYAITKKGGPSSGYVGFTKESFGYGAEYETVDLGLNGNTTLRSRRFFSCNDSNTFDSSIVLIPYKDVECFEIDLHLLPYNKTSQLPVEGSYVLQKFDSTPHAFFIQANNTLKRISYYTVIDTETLQTHGVFFHQSEPARLAAFTLKHNIAYSQYNFFSGFVGFRDNSLVFGDFIPQTRLDLGSDMMIKGHHFYSCSKDRRAPKRELFMDITPHEGCYEVEIYLLPFNRRTGRPMRPSKKP